MCDSQINCAKSLLEEIYTIKVIFILIFIFTIIKHIIVYRHLFKNNSEYQSIRMNELTGL